MKKLIEIVYNPRKVFQEDGSFIIPFIAVIILSIVFLVILTPVRFEQILQNVTERIQDLPQEQQERILGSMTVKNIIIRGGIAILIMVPIKIILQALIYQVSLPLIGGELSLKNSLFILSYANLISTFSGFLKVPVALISKNINVRTDLSIFLPQGSGYLWKVLSQIDLFTIWSLGILGLGLSIMGKVEKKKAYILVGMLWLAYILLMPLIPWGRGGLGR